MMRNLVKIQTLLFIAIFISTPFFLVSQEETKEKKVRIKTVKEVDGKKVVSDTTFTVTGEDDVKKVVKQYTIDDTGDGTTEIIVDVEVDGDYEIDKNKKVIILKSDGDNDLFSEEENVFVTIDDDGNKKVIVHSAPHHGSKKVMKFKSEDGEGEEVIIISPHHGSHKTIKWVGEDGKEHDFDMDQDYEFEWHGEHMEEALAEMDAEMRELHIEMLDEKGNLHRELIELETLKGLEHLEELETLRELEFYTTPDVRFHDNYFTPRSSPKVTDVELRDAGIKNKQNRLELEEININQDDGVVDLSFSLKSEGSAKVTVYNVYGDKVFNGKPEMMNGKYEIKIDLSQKQHGTYYLMIVVGDSSKTMRLKN